METLIVIVLGIIALAIAIPFLFLGAVIVMELVNLVLLIVFGWPVWFWCKIFGRNKTP